ncbi:MAG: hypothetical protein M3O61_04585 [Gemmatimonadota bacterium]|nr:hypothetical protein [Gemmatimonadota bacterium]
MSLSLKESTSARELAKLLYDFLPGSGSRQWKGHVSFKTVAEQVGVGDYWQPGSKEPMIAQLLERTLEFRRGRFEPLVVEIVRAGLTYRRKNGHPVSPEEIERINAQILAIGFKFPDLWDADFQAALSDATGARAQERVEEARTSDRLRESVRSRRSVELEALKQDFLALHDLLDRQEAGRRLEGILNRLFAHHALAPREAFRLQGEQIDGSFELDHEVYLLEAKWHQDPRPAADLYVFREKIEGKSRFTRGVFLSVNGISQDAALAITQGKQPIFFVMDGYDLLMALEDNVALTAFLRRRQRLLAEEGRVCVPFHQCGV